MDPSHISSVVSFLFGLLVGGSLGAMAMALLSYSRSDDDDDVEHGIPAATKRRP